MKRSVFWLIAVMLFFAPVNIASSSDCDARLQAIGALSSSYLYITFNYIGVTADAYASEAYKSGTVASMMNETISFMELAHKQLMEIGRGDLSDEDKKTIDGMVEVVMLLEKEASCLRDFAATGKESDADGYHQARKQALEKLNKLLGIEGEPDKDKEKKEAQPKE